MEFNKFNKKKDLLAFPGVVEQFIEGIEVGIDVYSTKENHFVYDPIFKSETSLQNIHSVEKLRVAKYPFSNKKIEKLREIGRCVAAAVNSTVWINIDMVMTTNGEIYVLDVNSRNGGTTRMNGMASHINPYTLAIDLYLNPSNKDYSRNLPFLDLVVEFPIFNVYSLENTQDFYIYYPTRPKSYKGIVTARIPYKDNEINNSLNIVLNTEDIMVKKQLQKILYNQLN